MLNSPISYPLAVQKNLQKSIQNNEHHSCNDRLVTANKAPENLAVRKPMLMHWEPASILGVGTAYSDRKHSRLRTGM